MATTGCGKIKNRDNHSLWNTDQEHKLRVPEDAFWKKYAAECSRVQIAVDVFSFWFVATLLPAHNFLAG